jgi:hypothetical protein
MKAGGCVRLTNDIQDPAKTKMVRNVIKVIAAKNSIRILVNSTGAFPMNPEVKKRA